MLMQTNIHHRQQCFPATWNYVNGYLIEARDDREVRVWGPWEGAFGCAGEDGIQVEPEWLPLGRLGVWHDPVGNQDEAWFASRSALAAYWSAIPTQIRLKAALAGGDQWQTLLNAHRTKATLRVALPS